MATRLLTDEEVFGRLLTDEEVFGPQGPVTASPRPEPRPSSPYGVVPQPMGFGAAVEPDVLPTIDTAGQRRMQAARPQTVVLDPYQPDRPFDARAIPQPTKTLPPIGQMQGPPVAPEPGLDVEQRAAAQRERMASRGRNRPRTSINAPVEGPPMGFGAATQADLTAPPVAAPEPSGGLSGRNAPRRQALAFQPYAAPPSPPLRFVMDSGKSRPADAFARAMRGFTEVGATLPETLAIIEAAGERSISKDATGYVNRAVEQIRMIQERFRDNPNMSAEDRTRLVDVLRQSQATIDNYGPISVGSEEWAKIQPAYQRDTYKLGEALRETSSETFGEPNPIYDNRFWSQVYEGGGNMLGFMAATLAGNAVGGPAGSILAGAGAGAQLNSAAMYRAALDAGADEETALATARIGALIGSTEVIPLARLFKYIPRAARTEVSSAIVRRFVDAARQGGEEAAQEALAGIANNLTAKYQYDPEKGVWEGVADEAAVGGILGVIMGGALSSRPQQAPDTPPDRRSFGDPSTPPLAFPGQDLISPEDNASPIPNEAIGPGKQVLQDLETRPQPAQTGQDFAPIRPTSEQPPNRGMAQVTPQQPEGQGPRNAPVIRTQPPADVPEGAVPLDTLYETPEPGEAVPGPVAAPATAGPTGTRSPSGQPDAGAAPDADLIPEVDGAGNLTGRMVRVDSETGDVQAVHTNLPVDPARPQQPQLVPTQIGAEPPTTPAPERIPPEVDPTLPLRPDQRVNVPAPEPGAADKVDQLLSDGQTLDSIREFFGSFADEPGSRAILDEVERRASVATPQPEPSPIRPQPRPRTVRVAPDRPQKRPLAYHMRTSGVQVHPDSEAAQELRSVGITARTHPGLYSRGRGVQSLDNIPAAEHTEIAQIVGEDGNGYLDPRGIIDQLDIEAREADAGRDARSLAEAERDRYKDFVEAEAARTADEAYERLRDPDQDADEIDLGPMRPVVMAPEGDIRTGGERFDDTRAVVRGTAEAMGVQDILTPAEINEITAILDENGGDVEDAILWQFHRSADRVEGAQTDEDLDIPWAEPETGRVPDARRPDEGGAGRPVSQPAQESRGAADTAGGQPGGQGQAAAPQFELTPEGQQAVIPGAEQSEQRSTDARRADQRRELDARARQSRMGTTVEQGGAGPLFGDEGGTQGDLLDQEPLEQPAPETSQVEQGAEPTDPVAQLMDEAGNQPTLEDAVRTLGGDFTALKQEYPNPSYTNKEPLVWRKMRGRNLYRLIGKETKRVQPMATIREAAGFQPYNEAVSPQELAYGIGKVADKLGGMTWDEFSTNYARDRARKEQPTPTAPETPAQPQSAPKAPAPFDSAKTLLKTPDPLRKKGDWQDAEIVATNDDGSQVEVEAGKSVRELMRSLGRAVRLMECMNA